MVSVYKHEQVWAQIGGDNIWESADVNLWVYTIDRKLKFDKHVSNICSKASRKLPVIARMSKFLIFEKKEKLFSKIFKKHFLSHNLSIVYLFGCFTPDI